MRIGVITPVVTLNPRAHNEWERTATWSDVVRIVRACDELGVHHVTASEHVAVPAAVEGTRGVRYYDPLAVFGALSAVTTSVRFCTYVLVLGYHHPLEIVKRYGTLDVVSGGRLILGVGVGTLREEFELIGASFADRGDRADESLRELRASLSTRRPPSYPEFVVEPCAQQERVPIWIGGRTRRSLRRAVELADGWCPFGMPVDDLRAAVRAAGPLPDEFDLVLRNDNAVDPLGDADSVHRDLDALAAAGATIVNVRLVASSPEQWIDQLHRMMELAAP